MNLTDINGIGKSTATKFNEVGVETIEDLAKFDNPDDFEFPVKQEWIDEAKALTKSDAEASESESEPEDGDTNESEQSDPEEASTETTDEPAESETDSADSDSSDEQSDSSHATESSAIQSDEPDVEESEEERDPINVNFTIESGDHKGKKVAWKEGDPSVVIGNTGQYIALSAIAVTKMEDNNGITRFKFTWGGTVGSAELPADVYNVFSAAVKKKRVLRS